MNKGLLTAVTPLKTGNSYDSSNRAKKPYGELKKTPHVKVSMYLCEGCKRLYQNAYQNIHKQEYYSNMPTNRLTRKLCNKCKEKDQVLTIA